MNNIFKTVLLSAIIFNASTALCSLQPSPAVMDALGEELTKLFKNLDLTDKQIEKHCMQATTKAEKQFAETTISPEQDAEFEALEAQALKQALTEYDASRLSDLDEENEVMCESRKDAIIQTLLSQNMQSATSTKTFTTMAELIANNIKEAVEAEKSKRGKAKKKGKARGRKKKKK